MSSISTTWSFSSLPEGSDAEGNPLPTDHLLTPDEAKERVKAIRLELVKIAVELGADQQNAAQGGADSFLDGFLVAQGIVPHYRDPEEEAA